MKSVALILREQRESLWQRWVEALDGVVEEDYRQLLASHLGERVVRDITHDLVACAEAEPYELPSLLRVAGDRVAAETTSRLALGFSALDVVRALQVLRRVTLDVLVDALATDEMPSFADTLLQLKSAESYLDALVCAVVSAA